MNELVMMKNKQVVTSSLQIADTFEKEHKNVTRDIKELEKDVLNFEHMFLEGSEPDSYGRKRKVYYMNRDGFTLLAMGFTGKKALEFKLKYIQAFNEMEKQIKAQLDTSNLSPELQMFNQMFKSLANQEIETKQLKEQNERIENKVNGITELFSMETKDWRKEVNSVLKRIAVKQGGFDKFKEIGTESYKKLEEKARCNLDIRLENRRKNMIAQGMGKTSVKRLNKLDIISEDHRLKEIYVTVVQKMAIKYGVHEDIA